MNASKKSRIKLGAAVLLAFIGGGLVQSHGQQLAAARDTTATVTQDARPATDRVAITTDATVVCQPAPVQASDYPGQRIVRVTNDTVELASVKNPKLITTHYRDTCLAP